MKEYDIHSELASIRDRVSRAEQFKQDITGKPIDAKDRLLANIFGHTAHVVRSEVPADPEELAITIQKVNETRKRIINYVQDFTQHPEYGHLNPAMITTESEQHDRDIFWMCLGDFEISHEPLSKFDLHLPGISSDYVFTHYTSPFEVHADRTPYTDNGTPIGAYLCGLIVDDVYLIYFKFGFDSTCLLSVDFFDDSAWNKSRAHYAQPSNLRFSVDTPISDMTQQEAKITEHYLDQFLTATK